MSGKRLYIWLKDEVKFKTKNGKFLSLGNIYLTLRTTFYYGSFEYPRGSGKWYQGKHTPIITKELFDRVQEQISEHIITNQSKEFAFTKVMTCGLCGSGITADEKFKKQKNGNVHRYIYYTCCKSADKHCKGGYLREEDLVEKLTELIDTIHLDEIGMKEKIKTEIERHKQFNVGILGIKGETIKVADVDIRNYAKHVLRNGTTFEKRELIGCLKSKIILSNKQVNIVL
ncbi:recombinase family protein [Candidatus Nomurabacteria bacterium]|nr:recombinase family protein [Candidatus Nomurabacteria bacterium]